MPTKQVIAQSNRVTTEGDDLYYEVRGQGLPLVMIPGAGGDAQTYSSVADILSDEYKAWYLTQGGVVNSLKENLAFWAKALMTAAGEGERAGQVRLYPPAQVTPRIED